MNFLKDIAMAALVTTALSAGAFAADFVFTPVTKSKAKFTMTGDLFEASVKKDGSKFGGKTSALAKEILDETSAEVVKKAKALDSKLDEDSIIALVKKHANNEELELAMNAAAKAFPADTKDEAVQTLSDRIVGKLGLKDADEAAVEQIASDGEFNVVKGVKVTLPDTSETTLEELAKNPKTAKGAVLKLDGSNVPLKDFFARRKMGGLKHLVLLDDYHAHKEKVKAHEATINSHVAEIGDLKKKLKAAEDAPKENADHKKAFDILAGLQAALESAGLADDSEMPGYVKDDAQANLQALFDLVVNMSTTIGQLEQKLEKASKQSASADASGGDKKATPNLGGQKVDPKKTQKKKPSDAQDDELTSNLFD